MLRRMGVTELLKDLNECLDDIATCNLALSQGVYAYSGGGVSDRKQVNEKIANLIYGELTRRGFSIEILDKRHVSESQLAVVYGGPAAMWSESWNGEGKDVQEEKQVESAAESLRPGRGVAGNPDYGWVSRQSRLSRRGRRRRRPVHYYDRYRGEAGLR